jgi:cobalt-zinc-cadmium efflux system membrane fusion protein
MKNQFLSPLPKRLGILASAGVLIIAACSRGAEESAATDSAADKPAGGFSIPAAQLSRIHIVPVRQMVFRPTISTTGTVAFNGDRTTQVLAPVSGPVTGTFVSLGARVSAGTPLASVSSPDFASAVANFRKAETAYQHLKRIATLDEELFKTDAIAHRDVEQAEADAAAAAADRDAAAEQMRSLGVDRATISAIQAGRFVASLQAVIRAPISGIVVEKLVNPGQLLQAGTTPTFTVADVSSMWVSANVFEADLPNVHRGESAAITVDPTSPPMAGTVDNVADLVDPSTKATGVRIVVSNPRGALKRDMLVRVSITADREQTGLLVPTSAVLRSDENLPFVFVALPGGGFNRRQVTLGPRVGDMYQVLSGLAAGERVVSEGGLFLQFAETQ